MQQTDLTSRIFHIYRLGLSGILLAIYVLFGEDFFGSIQAPSVFLVVNICWFVVATITSFSSFLSRQLDWLNCTSFLVDIAALSLLGWANGGLNGGIFFLLLPSAALAGLLLPSRLALLVASVATIATFAAQTALIFDFKLPPSIYFPSGVLGSLIFLSALVCLALAKRISTSEKEARENLERAESLQQINEAVIERMQTGVLVLNEHRVVTMANLAAQRMLSADMSSRSIVGEHLSSLPNLFKTFEAWSATPKKAIQAFTHSYSGISMQPSFSHIKRGEQQQTLVWLEDTRTIRQRAQQFKFQSLSKISSGLAHEVRNPLSAVQQANDLLLESSELSDTDRELTDIIGKHCHRMNEIIDVVQQLSRRVESNPEHIDLQHWIPEFLQEFYETHGQQQNLELQMDENVAAYFDTRHLKQVLSNLLENGIKHGIKNPEDTLVLKIHQSENSRYSYMDVIDPGPGISRKDQRKIFDPFYTTGKGGSGLGLYLARELCEANYASINYLYDGEAQSTGYFRLSCQTEAPLK